MICSAETIVVGIEIIGMCLNIFKCGFEVYINKIYYQFEIELYFVISYNILKFENHLGRTVHTIMYETGHFDIAKVTIDIM